MLNNRITSFEGESLSSYLYRLAQANYVSNPTLVGYLEITMKDLKHNLYPSNLFQTLGDWTGAVPQDLYQMSLNPYVAKWGESFVSNETLKSRVKYCPICIQYETYHKWHWSFRFLTVCDTHQVFLIDHCPNCKSEITLNSLMKGLCHECRLVLDERTTKQICDVPFIYESNSELLMRICGASCNILSQLNFPDYVRLAKRSFHLLQGLTSFVSPTNHLIQGFPNQRAIGVNNYNTAVALANVYWMYQRLENFHEVLQEFQKKHPDIRYEQKSQFEKLFYFNKYQSIEQWYSQFWLTQLEAGVIRQDFSIFRRNTKLLSQRSTVSKEEIKTNLGITSKRMEKFQGNGQIEIQLIQNGAYKRYAIQKDLVIQAQIKQQEFVSRTRAAEMLGIHVNTFRKLTTAGLIPIKTSPSGEQLISVSEIHSFLASCRSTFRENAKGLSLYEATQNYRGYGLNLVSLMQWIQTGKIKVFCTKVNGTLADVVINMSSLSSVLQEIRDTRMSRDGYQLEHVMRMLGVGERTIREMISRGIVSPKYTMQVGGGRTMYWFDKQEIDAFVSEHIRLKQASELYNIPRHRLYRWVEAGMLTNYLTGITRRPLLRKAEIEKMIMKNQ